MSNWTAANIPDQHGRRAIVTGSNTGIGFETALVLAEKGAEVTLACRNMGKADVAKKRIAEAVPGAKVDALKLDLSDLESVQAFADGFREAHDLLDLLILNAGVMVPPPSRTAQGFELQFGVNHLGHFALTAHLLPLLSSTDGARVVTVSSIAASMGKMDFKDLNANNKPYRRWALYGQSKLANQLFTRELDRRLRAVDSSVAAIAAHPGYSATDLQRSDAMSKMLNPVFAMKASQGALPSLRAATDQSACGGDYFGHDGFMQVRGFPVRTKMVRRAMNDSDAARLWDMSELLTGVQFDFTLA